VIGAFAAVARERLVPVAADRVNMAHAGQVVSVERLGAWGAEMRSCSSPVLMQESAKEVTSVQMACASLVDGI
jgi:hypothetical protein